MKIEELAYRISGETLNLLEEKCILAVFLIF